ncbi:MAG: MOSC domain-containing protein [Myxococcota bacterium]
MSETVGRIQSIWRFPIKSFQGESIAATSLSAAGIHGDRVLALRNRETGKIVSGKHARLGERVLEFQARYVSEPVAGQPLPRIRARIDGVEVFADDPSAFASACSEALQHPVELTAPGASSEVYESDWPDVEDLPLAGASLDLPLPLAEAGSFADLEPLHLLTTASLAHLSSLAGESRIGTSRFRPGLVLDTGDAGGFPEHDWSGRTATLGGARLELGGPTPRCLMSTLAQEGLPRDPSIMRTLIRENRREFMGMQMPCLGIYAKVVEPGEIAVGDALTLA